MAFKDRHSPSILMKSLLILGLLGGIVISTLLTTGNSIWLSELFQYEGTTGSAAHLWLMFACGMFYVLRFIIGMFVLMQRNIGWVEGLMTSLLFFMMFYLFGISAGKQSEALGLVDYFGVGIFLIGSYINFKADYDRWKWKQLESNQGKLYTSGLFKYSMHINYFGDSLTYLGLAMITHTGVCYLIVFGICLNFIFYQIPQLDKYLLERYTDQFMSYRVNTKKFIPFIY
ncbi:MAG: DUF1295 domain-containing protein [Candidatus Marinimicrobia bacterium]|nr:DUF1295 domain-containing protein [Candidatus Neomarinimicrobiota bacterium]